MEKKEILNSKIRRAPKEINMQHKRGFLEPKTKQNNQTNQINNLLEELGERVLIVEI